MIKKLSVRFMTMLLACCVVLTGLAPVVTQTAEAKSSPKLSSKSIILVKGGSKKISLKSGKGSWTIQGNGVAKLTSKKKKSVTVVPLKPGDTVVTCKVGKKKLKCKVKVLNNRIGNPKEENLVYLLEGKSASFSIDIPEGEAVRNVTSSNGNALVSYSVTGSELNIKINPKKAGRFNLVIQPESSPAESTRMYVIKNFRGKTKAKKNKTNYNKWRRQFLLSTAGTDMSTWEIIHAAGYLISTGKYSLKGGATGMQLWYGSNGTCVSGAKMMSDFMKDVGVKNKIRFAGKMKGPVDIYGANIMYGSQHKNVRIKLDGKYYELNPQPGFPWPYGIVKRSSL